MVHKGFHASYTANGFNDKLLARLEHILFRCANQQKEAGTDKPVNVYVTGWVLGVCVFAPHQELPSPPHPCPRLLWKVFSSLTVGGRGQGSLTSS
jgi:hypothetical protein